MKRFNFLNFILWCVAMCILASLIPSAKAQPAWDSAADFTPGENSANAWTWGWRYPTGEVYSMVPIDRCGIYKNHQGDIPGFDCFTAWDSGWTIPQILKNNSGAAVKFVPAGTSWSSMVLGQDALFLRIGFAPDGRPMYPVIRFTAPKTGAYDFLVSAQLIDKAAEAAIVHMTRQPDKRLEGFGNARHFQPVYQLQAGETVDLWVTHIGNVFYSTTAIRMSVMRRDQ